MPETERTSLMLRPDQKALLEEMAANDNPRIGDMSEAARHLIDEAQRVDDLETEIDELRTEIQALRNEKRVLINDYQDQSDETSDETALVTPDDDDSLIDRLSWLIRGR